MAGLSEFRNQYPQYADVPDAELADSLHAKFYSDIPKDQYLESLGMGKPSLMSRAGAALKPAEREPMPSTADTINAGWTNPPEERLSVPGSVMDGYTPSENGQGLPVEAGMGPMRKDYYDQTRAGLLSAPVEKHAAAAKAGGQVGKIAAESLPARVVANERAAAGDTQARTMQELGDQTNASLTAQPLRTEAAKEANRQWLTENSAGAIEGIKRFTKLDHADAEAELQQMIRYGVKPSWVDSSTPDATLMQAASANIGATGPALQKALLGLSEAAADQPMLQLPWVDYAKRTPRQLEMTVTNLDKQIRAARNVGGKIEAGSWNDVVSTMGPSLATNMPPLIAAALVAAKNPAAGMAIANGGLGVMGMQKFGDNYLKGQMKGLSAADNLTQASLGAAAEVIPEKLSLNSLFAAFKTLGKGSAIDAVKAFAKQQLTEHSTEQITTIADHLIDKAYTEPNKSIESLWSEMKQTAMATAIQAPLLAAGGAAAHITGQAVVGAKQRFDEGRDITAGMQFDPGQIDAAARQALDPANAQMRQVGTRAAPVPPPASTRAELAAVLSGNQPVAEILAAQAPAAAPPQATPQAPLQPAAFGWPDIKTPAVATLPDGQIITGQIAGIQDSDGQPMARFVGADGQVWMIQPGEAEIKPAPAGDGTRTAQAQADEALLAEIQSAADTQKAGEAYAAEREKAVAAIGENQVAAIEDQVADQNAGQPTSELYRAIASALKAEAARQATQPARQPAQTPSVPSAQPEPVAAAAPIAAPQPAAVAPTVEWAVNKKAKSETLAYINGELMGGVFHTRSPGTSDWGWKGMESRELHFTQEKAMAVERDAVLKRYERTLRNRALDAATPTSTPPATPMQLKMRKLAEAKKAKREAAKQGEVNAAQATQAVKVEPQAAQQGAAAVAQLPADREERGNASGHPLSNVVIRDVRTNGGAKLGDLIEPYDGTKEGALKVAKRMQDRFDGYQDASNIQSRIGATDEQGRPKWAISPNLAHISPVDTVEGRATFGDEDAIRQAYVDKYGKSPDEVLTDEEFQAANPQLKDGGAAQKRYFSGLDAMTITEAVNKARWFDAESRKAKSRAGAAETKAMQTMADNAASTASTAARTLRKEIAQYVDGFADAKAEYEAAQNPEASRPNPVAEKPQAPAPSEPGDGGVAPTQDKALPVAEERAYTKGQAEVLARRMTNQGLPSEAYPHPTQTGMWAIRVPGEEQPAAAGADFLASNRAEFRHEGFRIYPISIKGEPRWAVQSLDNSEKEKKDERQIGGDAIVDTPEQAKQQAEDQVTERGQKAERQRQFAEQDATEEAKKEANRGLSITQRRANAALDKPTNLPVNAGVGRGTRREAMESAVSQERAITAVDVRDTAAYKRDEDEQGRLHRAGYGAFFGNDSHPQKMRFNELSAKLKNRDNYQKKEYRLYMGRDTDGSFYDITKTEYDYAQTLIATKKAEASTPAPSAPTAKKEPWQYGELEYGDKYINEVVLPQLRKDLENAHGGKFQEYKSKAAAVRGLKERIDTLENHRDAKARKYYASLDDHYAAVRRALAAGKDVPPVAYESYDDLKADVSAGRIKGDGQEVTRVLTPKHIEAGKTETATVPVIAASIKESAKNTPMNIEQAREWLLSEIDKAIIDAKSAKDEDVWDRAEGKVDLKGRMDVKETIGYKVFDVPGDGRFSVLNLKESLQKFKKQVAATPGFKKNATRPMSVANGSGGKTSVRDMLEDGEYVLAADYGHLIGEPLLFGAVRKGEAHPIAYTNAEPVDIKGIEAQVGREWNQTGKAFSWRVIETTTGASVSSETTKERAVSKAKAYVDEHGADKLIAQIKETPKVSQSELERQFTDWGSEEEAKAQKTRDAVERADTEDRALWNSIFPLKDGEKRSPNPWNDIDHMQVVILAKDAAKAGKGDEFVSLIERRRGGTNNMLALAARKALADAAPKAKPAKGSIATGVASKILGDIYQRAAYNKWTWDRLKSYLTREMEASGVGKSRMANALEKAMTEYARTANGRLGYPNSNLVFSAMRDYGLIAEDAAAQAKAEPAKGYPFYSSNKLFNAEGTAELPKDWTGVARSDSGKRFFYLGQENGERSVNPLKAESYEDALKEAEGLKNDKPVIPEGYREVARGYFGGTVEKPIYAPFAEGERVRFIGGHAGQIQSFIGGPVTTGAIIKYDNGLTGRAEWRDVEAVKKPAAEQEPKNFKSIDALNAANNPLGEDDWIRFADGSEWQVKGRMNGWVLMQGKTEHPTVKNIMGQVPLIRAVIEANDAAQKPKEPAFDVDAEGGHSWNVIKAHSEWVKLAKNQWHYRFEGMGQGVVIDTHAEEGRSGENKWRTSDGELHVGLAEAKAHEIETHAKPKLIENGYLNEAAQPKPKTIADAADAMIKAAEAMKAAVQGESKPKEDVGDVQVQNRIRTYWMDNVVPPLRDYFAAYRAMGADRLERNGIKPEGMSATDWLMSFSRRESTWSNGRKTGETGIQYLSHKDLWPTGDDKGEILRKAMLASIKALKASPGSNGSWIESAEQGNYDVWDKPKAAVAQQAAPEAGKPAATKEPAQGAEKVSAGEAATAEESSGVAPYDATRAQELKNSITEGEMIAKSGKTVAGRKMTSDEINAVKRSIENDKAKLAALGRPDTGIAFNSLEDDHQSAVTRAIDRAIAIEQGKDVKPLQVIRVRNRIGKLRAEWEAGKLTQNEFIAEVEKLHAQMEIAAESRKYEPTNGRARGADFLRQKLLEAKRRGDISEQAADMAEWFILKNPALVDDLGIGIRTPKEGQNASGNYNPLNRVMTLFKESASDTTAIHEILHHLERMMPAEMQAEIRKEWLRAVTGELQKAQKAKDQKRIAYFEAVLVGNMARATKLLTGEMGWFNAVEPAPTFKPLPPAIEQAAIKQASEVQNEKDAFDIAEEIRSLEEGGGVDLSKLFENPKLWDSENEQWTPEGLEASASATRAQAIDNLRLRDITEMSDLELANHKAQYAAMLEILNGMGIPYIDTSSAQSKYIEVGGYKLRFADHANQVRDSAVRGSLPVINVAPGETTFAGALRVVMESTQAAPTFKAVDTGSAAFTPARIDRLMRKYAYTMDDSRTKAFAAWISPDDFLRLTSSAVDYERIAGETTELDVAELRQQDQELFLEVDDISASSVPVVGHEGRHRAMAMKRAGIERMPVTIYLRKGAMSGAGSVKSLYLGSQRFGGNDRAMGGAFVSRLTPISYEYQEELLQEFGGKAEINFDLAIGQDYQYLNPSEFWAVRMTNTMAARFEAKSIWARSLQWLKEALEHIKGALGLKSDHPLLKALDDLIARGTGEFVSKEMLGSSEVYAAPRIIGDSGRQYTPDQEAMFKQTGREVDQGTILGKLKEWAAVNWRQGLFDQFQPARAISTHGYTLLRLSKGATGAFEALMGHGKLSIKDGAYDADTSGGVMQEVFFPIGKETTDFLYWIAGNRAERLAMEGKERLFSSVDIAAAKSLAQGTTDFDYTLQSGQVTRDRTLIYRDSLAKFNAFNKNVMDMAEQSGLIDAASRHLWEHEFYVPFYRVMDEKDGGVRGMNIKQGVVRQQAFKKLKGGKEGLNDLLANTLMNWAHLIDASAKNRGAKETLEAAVRLGAAHPAVAGEKNTVWYMDGGKKVELTVDDPELMVAISALDYSGLRGIAMDALSKPKHWLTIGVTASPFFKIRNLIRDSVQAVATSGLSFNIAGNVAEGIKLTNRDRQEYVSALAGGGLIRFGTMLEGNEAARTRQLIKKGATDEHILDSEGKVRRFYDKFLEPAVAAYNELGNRGEEINRMSLYDQLTKQGVDHATASLMARDLMDFSMQGSWTAIRFLAQIVPFFNARMQGMYKLGRAAKSDPAKFATVLGAVTVFSLALLAAYHDDDDWKKREEWDRDNYWWFKVGGVAFRIPKPFEIGAIATLAERSAELMFDDEMTGKRFRKVTTKLLADQLSMNPTPQLIKPIIDLYANKDSFSGRPIETMGMERVDSERRFNSGTSIPARGLSTAIGGALSPVQIDHLVRGYFAWLGAFTVGAADMAVRAASNEPTKPASDYWKVATGGMIAGLDGASSRYVSQMYDQAKEIEMAYNTYRDMLKAAAQKQGAAKTETLDEAKEYRESNADKLNRYRGIEGAKRRLSTINQRIKSIERGDMTADEKRQAIIGLNKQKDMVARQIAR